MSYCNCCGRKHNGFEDHSVGCYYVGDGKTMWTCAAYAAEVQERLEREKKDKGQAR